jgi:hypothetical protein
MATQSRRPFQRVNTNEHAIAADRFLDVVTEATRRSSRIFPAIADEDLRIRYISFFH